MSWVIAHAISAVKSETPQNDRCQPFVWTKTADDILTKANRKVTLQTRDTSRVATMAQACSPRSRLYADRLAALAVDLRTGTE